MIGIPTLSQACADKWRELLFMQRHMRACRELQRITEERANSYETRRFRERRAAALKHTRKGGTDVRLFAD